MAGRFTQVLMMNHPEKRKKNFLEHSFDKITEARSSKAKGGANYSQSGERMGTY